MADAITIQELIDARTDAKTLEEAVNGDAVTTVLSRLGESYPTLANALSQIDGKLDSADAQIKQAITDLFENGGLPATPFATKALMESSELVDGDYAMVTDDTVNNGLYVKTSGSWVKSTYDPLAQAKTYTDTNKADTLLRVQNVFATKALMIASSLVDGSNAQVNDDTTADNNGFYKKTAGAWVKSGYDPLAQAKADSDVLRESINAISNNVIASQNILDPSVITKGNFLNTTDGSLKTSTSFYYSDYITVKGDTYYSHQPSSVTVCQYTTDKVFIGVHESRTKTDASAKYIRISFHESVLSGVALYQNNYLSIKDDFKVETLPDLSKHVNLTVRPIDTDFISTVSGKNIVNPLKGKSGYLDSVGNEMVSEAYWITDYIPVTPNTTYSTQGYIQWVEYDANKNIINVERLSSLVTGSDTRFIRTHTNIKKIADKSFTIVEGVFTNNTPYIDYKKIDNLKVDNLFYRNRWTDKTILWLGTSIPNGAGYPETVAENLGAKLIKNTLGGGRARAFELGGEWEIQRFLEYQFTLKKSEVQDRYADNLGKKVKAEDYLTEDANGVVLTQAMIDFLVRNNYETKLIPYIAESDIFIIDYGINDGVFTSNAEPEKPTSGTQFDRTTMVGAMGFIVKTILDAKPNAQIVIVSHHHAMGLTSETVSRQVAVAKYWGLPFMDITGISGVNEITLSTLTGDNLHPIKNGILSKRYAAYITEKLKALGH